MSSSSILQALGKFLPVIYQQGTTTSQRRNCPPCPQTKYHIGDLAEGGVIIWLTQDGNHGLVAAIEDAESLQKLGTVFVWGPKPSSLEGVQNNDSLPFSTSIAPYGQNYGGYKNQTAPDIINNLSSYPAFWAAANFTITVNGQTYADWWLPSSTELSLMYTIRDKINEVSLANGGSALRTNNFYWSSRESVSNFAWCLYFFDGNQATKGKVDPSAVRCVRAF